jgi:WD40 repeat protein
MHPEQPAAEDAPGGTWDAFVSYSRRDRGFVEWLHAELEKRGKDVYVDWDIPDWSPDYEVELESAIRAADAFVFVLSPSAVASENCRFELDVAVAGGKRIRPVVCRAVDGSSVPPTLRAPQWLDLSESDAAAVDKLVAALDVDPDWVQLHTRLLVRAHEWAERGRDDGYLLHGSDLRSAERWLGGQAGKEPPPTPLQTELIMASRRRATRRQRAVLGSVVAGLVVTAALAVFALVQRSNAIHDASVARSRELAALSLGAGRSDPRASLDLALRATDTARTPEAADALRLALARTRAAATVDGTTGVSFAPGGNRGLYACPDGAVRRLAEAAAARCAAEGPYVRALFSSDGRAVLQTAHAEPARVVTTAPRSVVGTLPVPDGALEDAAVAPDGRRVVVLDGRETVHLWALPGGGGAPSRIRRRGGVDQIAASPDGSRFTTLENDGAVRLWNMRTGEPVAVLRRGGLEPALVTFGDADTAAVSGDDGVAVFELARHREPLWFPGAVIGALSRDGRTVALGRESGRVEVRTLAEPGRVVSSFAAPPGLIQFNPGGGELLDATEESVSVWSAAGGRRIALIRSRPRTFTGAALSRDGRLLLTPTDGGSATLWRVAPAGEVAALRPVGPASSTTGLRVDDEAVATAHEDGSVVVQPWAGGQPRRLHLGGAGLLLAPSGRLAAAAEPQRIRVWDTGTRAPVASLAAPGATSLAFDGGGTLLAARLPDGRVRVWDAASGRELHRTATRVAADAQLTLSPSGDRLLAWSYRRPGAMFLDLESGEALPLELPSTALTYAAFGPDGGRLAVAIGGTARLLGSDGTVRATLAGQQPEPGEESDAEPTLSLAFSPDGRLLAASRSDGTLRIWDAGTGAERYVVAGSNPVFSADSALFATTDGGGLDTAVRSTASGRQLLTVPGGGSPLAFSADGTRLVTLAGDTVRLLDCDSCGSLDRVRALARERLGRG